MTFFNKKEEVIQVELTQYGKYLLSKGKLRAKYYEFFDDDILYDSEYGGTSETNSDTGNRIRQETVSLKSQYTFSGIETNFKKILQLKREKNLKENDKLLQQTAEKHYFSAAPLGDSDLGSEYSPSWKITSLKGEFSNVETVQSGSHQVMFIPKITTKEIECKAVLSMALQRMPSNPNVPEDIDAENAGAGMNANPGDATTIFTDKTYFKVVSDFLLLDATELHVDQLKNNLEIEVFVEELNPITQQNELIPLFFPEKINPVKKNILVDSEMNNQQRYNYATDLTLVGHYLNIYVDEEIDPEILCKYLPETEKEFSFSNQLINCNEMRQANQNDLYETDADEDFCDWGV